MKNFPGGKKLNIYEPRHEVSNNLVCATRKASDQPAHMHEYSMTVNLLNKHQLMRNARFGPLTVLMTLRVINVKSDDKFTRLFYVSIHDANIRF